MKVLIVDDDDGTRGLIARIVQNQGHETAEASDGIEGLRAFKVFDPDLVFSDIQMPNMNGLQMLREIRLLDSDALVIIISGLDSPEYTLEALRLKANDYLMKPFGARALIRTIRKYSHFLETLTHDREILGMISHRNLGMKISNQLALVGKIADRLMLETELSLPHSDRLGVHLGLAEILINAIEHGNLEFSYAEKSRVLEEDPEGWEKIVEARSQTPPYANRQITIDFRMDSERLEWLITDEGPGFDWHSIPDPNDPANLMSMHGRGILLARLQFDECVFEGRGNQVRLVKRLRREKE